MKDCIDLLKALLKARGEFKPCGMSGKNPFFGNSRYSTLDDIKQATEDALLNNGLVVFHTIDDDKITCHLVHVETGQEITSTIEMKMKPNIEDDPLDDDRKKQTRHRNVAQEMGAWITYLRRYTLAPLLGIVADEDVDANDTYQQRQSLKKVEEEKIAELKEATDSNRKLAFLICKEVLHMDDDMMRDDIKKHFPTISSRSELTNRQWEEYVTILKSVHLEWKISQEQVNELDELIKPYYKGVDDPKFLEYVSKNICKSIESGSVKERKINSVYDLLYYDAEYIKRRINEKKKTT